MLALLAACTRRRRPPVPSAAAGGPPWCTADRALALCAGKFGAGMSRWVVCKRQQTAREPRPLEISSCRRLLPLCTHSSQGAEPGAPSLAAGQVHAKQGRQHGCRAPPGDQGRRRLPVRGLLAPSCRRRPPLSASAQGPRSRMQGATAQARPGSVFLATRASSPLVSHGATTTSCTPHSVLGSAHSTALASPQILKGWLHAFPMLTHSGQLSVHATQCPTSNLQGCRRCAAAGRGSVSKILQQV